jgi:hypothetical protein
MSSQLNNLMYKYTYNQLDNRILGLLHEQLK